MKVKLNDFTGANFIKIIREWTELTQEEFGREIGKSGQTIADYESGKTNYNIAVLERIAKKLNIQIIATKS